MAIFSLTLFTDLYAYYRLQRESILEKRVKLRSFDLLLTDSQPGELFGQASRLPNEKIVDISDTFGPESRQALGKAWQLAHDLRHQSVQGIHLLAVLVNYPQVQLMLGRLGISGKILVEKISRTLQNHPTIEKGDPVLGEFFRASIMNSYAEAFLARQVKVRPNHLLIGAVKADDDVRELFYDLEKDIDDVVNVSEWLNIQNRLAERWRAWQSKAIFKPKGVMNKSMTAQATPLLDRFSHDLTQLARSGYLPPCIGRDREIEETLRLIEGGKSVILVGNPGVGKTSVVEGIAELMASEEVPEILQDKRLVSLSVASLVGSAGRQGELEGLFMEIINEIVRSGNIVVYVDNFQNMIGVSTEGAENLDIADIFANALKQGLFFCISTTTPMDYRRYIEPRTSVTGVLQKVNIDEPDTNGTIQIIEAKAGQIEAKNQVYFSYEAIEKTVELAERYLQERYLPEKAITLLEEVGVYGRRKKGKNAVIKAEDVAEVISSKTNVPVTKITQKESQRLLNLEELIHQRMVDQEEAVRAVSEALRRARAELRDIRRPIVNLLFLGPTGGGKTELAKTVAEVYFGSEDNMIRLDMSEYQEQGSLSRMIGAAPGYAGSSAGGYLTEAIRAKPFSLLLLDEVEKAHPDILNVFLQVMDDGRLTDTLGRTIDFTNTIIIATSNAGTQLIQDRMRENVSVDKIKDELLNQTLKPYFRPEFLNRFDNIVVFKPLGMPEIIQIVGLMLKQVAARLESKGIKFTATPEAMTELAQKGFDPVFGARPLRRAIQDQVDSALASFLLQGKIGRRDVAVLEAGGRINVQRARKI